MPLPKVLGRGRRSEEISPPGKQVPSSESTANENRLSKVVELPLTKDQLSLKTSEETATEAVFKDGQQVPIVITPETEVSAPTQEDDEEKAIGVSPDGR